MFVMFLQERRLFDKYLSWKNRRAGVYHKLPMPTIKKSERLKGRHRGATVLSRLCRECCWFHNYLGSIYTLIIVNMSQYS